MDSLGRLLPVLHLTRAVGLLPFARIDFSSRRLVTSVTSRVLCATLVLSIAAVKTHLVLQKLCNFLALSDKQITYFSTQSSIYTFQFIGILAAAFLFYFSINSCNFINNIIQYLDIVDGAINYEYYGTKKCYSHKISFFLVSYSIVQIMYGSFVYKRPAESHCWYEMLDFYGELLWVLLLVAEQLLVVFCRELSARYCVINMSLDCCLAETKPWSSLTTEQVEIWREAHAILGDTQRKINENMGPVLLLNISFNFSILLCMILLVSLRFSPQEQYSKFIGAIMAMIETIVRTSIITFFCDCVSKESERTAETLTRLDNRTMNVDTKKELLMFTAQAQSRHVTFSACRLFNVDLPLLFSMIGAAISYTFILLQLK